MRGIEEERTKALVIIPLMTIALSTGKVCATTFREIWLASLLTIIAVGQSTAALASTSAAAPTKQPLAKSSRQTKDARSTRWMVPYTTVPGPPSTNGNPGAETNSLSAPPLQLNQALDESFLNNPRTSAIRSQLGIARSAYAQASVLPNPGVYIDYSEKSNCKYGIILPIEMPWRMAFRMIVARKQVLQSEADIAKFLWQFRGLVRKTYIEFLVAQEMADVRKRLWQLTQQAQQVANTRYDAGDVPRLDVRRAELVAIQAHVDSVQADQVMIQTREQLNVILARDIDAALSAPHFEPKETEEQFVSSGILPNFTVSLPDRDKLVTEAMASRYELLSLDRQFAVAKAALHNAEASIIPNQRFTFGRVNFYNLPTGPATTNFYFNATLEVPVVNLQQGDIARFRAQARQLQFEKQAQKNVITGEVALAYRKLAAARARLELMYSQALTASQSVIVISQHSYKLGQSDMNVLIDSATRDIQVRSLFLDALLAYQLALNDLEQSIGRPWE